MTQPGAFQAPPNTTASSHQHQLLPNDNDKKIAASALCDLASTPVNVSANSSSPKANHQLKHHGTAMPSREEESNVDSKTLRNVGQTSPIIRWTAKEERLLVALVRENGEQEWEAVASKMPGRRRSAKQCHDRY